MGLPFAAYGMAIGWLWALHGPKPYAISVMDGFPTHRQRHNPAFSVAVTIENRDLEMLKY